MEICLAKDSGLENSIFAEFPAILIKHPRDGIIMVERVRSAAEIEGGSQTWQGIRTTALSMVEQFCQKTGMNPAEFMSNMGWLRSHSWREGMDWKGMVNWNSFNEVIFSNIADNRRGLDLRSFTRTLEESRETFIANSTPQPVQQPRRRAAAPQPAEAEVPWRERANPPSDKPGRVAQDQAFGIVARYSQLTDEDRIALSNIVSGSADRTLMERNLQFYRRSLVSEGRLSEDQADSLFREIGAVGDGAVAARVAGRRPGTLNTVTEGGEVRFASGRPTRAAPAAPAGWMKEPAEQQVAAPARTERHTYTLAFT